MSHLAKLVYLLAGRWLQFVLLPLAVMAWFIATDPSPGGADTLLRVQLWAQAFAITGLAYLASKALAGRDISAEQAADTARKSANVGAGLVFVGLMLLRGLVFVGLLSFFAGQVRAAAPAVPTAALQHLPQLQQQLQQVWPDMPEPAYLGALIEHESCITLTHRRCWQPSSRLKTTREEGAGLGQLTRAWRPDGSLRFDALAEARRVDPRGLADLRWDTVYTRPDLQMRVIALTTRANYLRLAPLVADHPHRLAMADAAYNGGMGGLLNERRACGLAAGCNPQQWWGHVERHCLKSKQPLYAGRSACDINRHHVADVLLTRLPRYRAYLPPPQA